MQRNQTTSAKVNFAPKTTRVVKVNPFEQDVNVHVRNTVIDEKENLVSALRPILICMVLSGTCDLKVLTLNDDITSETRAKTSRVLRVYRIAIILIFSFNFLRHFSTYITDAQFGWDIVTGIMVQCWYLLCMIDSVACCYAIQDTKQLPLFFQLYHEFHQTRNLKFYAKARKYTVVATAFTWIFIIGNMIFSAYFLFCTNIFDTFIAPFNSATTYSTMIKVGYMIVHFFLSCTWTFPCGLTFVMFMLLKNDFQSFAKMFDLDVKEDTSLSDVTMREYRQRHQNVCRLTDVANDTWRIYIGANLIISTVIALLLMYNVCWYERIRAEAAHLIAHVFWLIAVLGTVAIITITCCAVNYWAHAPTDTIYRMSFKQTTVGLSLQVTLFLSRLTGQQIGLTALNLIVIDKQAIISILSLLVTYFVVLTQFQQARQI